jgi:SAM-dependent methyltransferase
MKVLEFRKLTTDDKYDKQFSTWSRIYEYPMVLEMIEKYTPNNDIKIHNSSWGHQGCHITFKDILEEKFNKVTNTDINTSKIANTGIWDITQENKEFEAKFDVVLNVSTVEEVNFNHVTILENLLKQVKPNGILICTFDIPGIQLGEIEVFINKKIKRFNNELNGSVSIIPNNRYAKLTCGLLVIKK